MPVPGARLSRAYALSLAAGAALALTLGACSGSGTEGAGGLTTNGQAASGVAPSLGGASAGGSTSPATPTTPPTPAATVTAPATTAHPGATFTTPAYPSDYFGAVITAYTGHNTAYLTLLTSASTASQMLGWGNINTHWHGLGTEGAAGSSYESFYNDAGDWLALKASNVDLDAHTWHAATVATWDKMSFPSDTGTYVQHFVDAWILGNPARMKLLSASGLPGLFGGLPRPDLGEYTVSVGGTSASDPNVYVTISQPPSVSVTVVVAKAKVGSHYAIIGVE